MNIAILYGEPAQNAGKDEQDTLVQVEAVSQALTELGHEPIPVSLSLNMTEAVNCLQRCQPNLVFNLVESVNAQGRLIHLAPAVLDSLHLPYTGAGTDAMFLTSNKLLTKKFLKSVGLPTPQWFSLQELREPFSIPKGQYIIKSVWEHASVGLSEYSVIWVENAAELRNVLIERCEQLGGECFAEMYIEGREFNLALLAGESALENLPPAEIRFDSFPEGKLHIVDYRAKWEEESFEYQNTPRRFTFPEEDVPLLQRLKSQAKSCWKLFDLRGYARVDFRVDQAQKPWILEVNANPCLSPDAGFLAAATQAGISMNQVIDRIIKDI